MVNNGAHGGLMIALEGLLIGPSLLRYWWLLVVDCGKGDDG